MLRGVSYIVHPIIMGVTSKPVIQSYMYLVVVESVGEVWAIKVLTRYGREKMSTSKRRQ